MGYCLAVHRRRPLTSAWLVTLGALSGDRLEPTFVFEPLLGVAPPTLAKDYLIGDRAGIDVVILPVVHATSLSSSSYKFNWGIRRENRLIDFL